MLRSYLHLFNSFFFVSGRNAQEDTQNLYNRRKRGDVIAVKADSNRGVGIARIKFKRAKEFGARGNPILCRISIFAAQAVKAGLECISNPGVKVIF